MEQCSEELREVTARYEAVIQEKKDRQCANAALREQVLQELAVNRSLAASQALAPEIERKWIQNLNSAVAAVEQLREESRTQAAELRRMEAENRELSDRVQDAEAQASHAAQWQTFAAQTERQRRELEG
jgi:hypothetical protein